MILSFWISTSSLNLLSSSLVIIIILYIVKVDIINYILIHRNFRIRTGSVASLTVGSIVWLLLLLSHEVLQKQAQAFRALISLFSSELDAAVQGSKTDKSLFDLEVSFTRQISDLRVYASLHCVPAATGGRTFFLSYVYKKITSLSRFATRPRKFSSLLPRSRKRILI